jgi:hypothetical protein
MLSSGKALMDSTIILKGPQPAFHFDRKEGGASFRAEGSIPAMILITGLVIPSFGFRFATASCCQPTRVINSLSANPRSLLPK